MAPEPNQKQDNPRGEPILFVEVPPQGLDPEKVQRLLVQGYKLWGIVPLATRPQTPGLILPGGDEPAVKTLVLYLDTNQIPVNLLAHQIVQAGVDKGGLDQLAKFFFGLSLGALRKGMEEARAKANG